MDITVTGQARDSRPPEQATLHMSVGFEDDDKAQVIQQTSALVTQISDQLAELRTMTPAPITWSAVLPIATSSWRPWNDQGTVLPLRFSAQSRIIVRFCDFVSLSTFCDHWGEQLGVTLGNVEWELTETTRQAVEAHVLTSAVQAAKTRAQTIAAAARMHEVTFTQIADPGLLDHNSPTAHYGGDMRMAALSGGSHEPITVQPENVETAVKIEARFSCQ